MLKVGILAAYFAPLFLVLFLFYLFFAYTGVSWFTVIFFALSIIGASVEILLIRDIVKSKTKFFDGMADRVASDASRFRNSPREKFLDKLPNYAFFLIFYLLFGAGLVADASAYFKYRAIKEFSFVALEGHEYIAVANFKESVVLVQFERIDGGYNDHRSKFLLQDIYRIVQRSDISDAELGELPKQKIEFPKDVENTPKARLTLSDFLDLNVQRLRDVIRF